MARAPALSDSYSQVAVLTYQPTASYLEFIAMGYVSADEAARTFQAIREDQAVPEGLPWLMDLRQYDQHSMSPEDMPARILRMSTLLGPKLGQFWAVVLDSQIEHLMRGRLLQQIVQDSEATVMLFREIDEAREWIEAMTARRASRSQSSSL